ncbi:hypothetical protein Asppvi_001650 [Aspergillus pseudoviridinutans]|uniref:Uncharacterized protein n=1 Tax=Aspergillus pseudoviridinutans TaxID=1517512 RepID=A0A9P3B2B7_9EURO|nr:uncharacterized protein Asppvi_001650 [Aspergillus pseudoviridinutans]GIJ83131.1 hypothetical protein Asppvi_001650 [Aspergillus pseudoviridinutans]
MSPEYWITSGDGVPVTIKDIQYIEGIDNTTGNLGTKDRDCAAHNWYFGNMTGCAEYYGPPPPDSDLICPKK